jgi:spermidine synthase
MKATDPESYDGIVCDLTDDPVGYDKDKFIGFYSEVFSLARVILRKNGWIAIYAGSKGFSIGHDGVIADLLGGILRNNFSETEYAEVSVPSYGEPSCFIYGIKPFSGLDVSP